MRNLVLFLGIIILISGCTNGGKGTEVISTDILKINDIDIFPSKELNPGDTLVIRMEVENVGKEDVNLFIEKKDETGDLLLIDCCNTRYTILENEFKLIPNRTQKESDNKKFITLKPDDIQYFQWKIEAPEKDALMGLTDKCMFKFQADYVSSAQTTTYIYFATPTEVMQRLYTDKELNLRGDNVASYGPLVINFETAEEQPISAGDGYTTTIRLTLKNFGSGIVNVTDLNLILPAGVSKKSCDMFDGETGTLSINKEKAGDILKIYKDKSSTISCTLNTPKVAVLTPYRFISRASYNYILREDILIKTSPELT